MPITAAGIAAAAAEAVLNKKAEVSSAWEARIMSWSPKRALTEDEQRDMEIEMEAAGIKELFRFIAENLQVTILPTAAGLQTGVASGPTLGPAVPVPLPPGSIS